MISVCCAYVSFVSDQPQQKGQGGEAMVTVHSRQDIDGLSDLVRAMVGDGVLDGRLRFSEGARGNRDFVDSKLAYEQAPGTPPAPALIKPFVHPSVPLVGLNYTPTAHNLLHRFFGGWTRPVRACRGIVFDRGGNLVGLGCLSRSSSIMENTPKPRICPINRGRQRRRWTDILCPCSNMGGKSESPRGGTS